MVCASCHMKRRAARARRRRRLSVLVGASHGSRLILCSRLPVQIGGGEGEGASASGTRWWFVEGLARCAGMHPTHGSRGGGQQQMLNSRVLRAQVVSTTASRRHPALRVLGLCDAAEGSEFRLQARVSTAFHGVLRHAFSFPCHCKEYCCLF